MTATRLLAPGRYGYDSLSVGDRVATGEAEITGALIDAFAELSGDRFEIHMDDAAARAKGFASRVAHGLLVLSVADGLKNRAPAQFAAIASLGWDMRFSGPVLAGDRISATITVREMRLTSAGDRGILTLEVEVRTADGVVVQSGINRLMVHR